MDPTQDHILQFFGYQHLPENLQAVSRPFCELAKALTDPTQPESVPRNPERTVALRKLLEAKDAAVRAVLAK
jgi:LmbE family N-acetylglucosaminyl deacetylase